VGATIIVVEVMIIVVGVIAGGLFYGHLSSPREVPTPHQLASGRDPLARPDNIEPSRVISKFSIAPGSRRNAATRK
jgi:hypothetical protein